MTHGGDWPNASLTSSLFANSGPPNCTSWFLLVIVVCYPRSLFLEILAVAISSGETWFKR